MVAGLAQYRSPAEPIRELLFACRKLPDSTFVTWHSHIAGASIKFRCTDAVTASLYQSRIAGGQAPDGPTLVLDLIETERVGWPSPAALQLGDLGSKVLTTDLMDHCLGVLMPDRRSEDVSYPWVFFDPAASYGVLLTRTVRDLPPWTSGCPLSLLFHLVYAWRGWRLLHAAVIGSDGYGLLLAGAGGAGKSATTLSALEAGLTTAGDDYVVVQSAPTPRAWPIYRLLKQTPAGLARFRSLDRSVTNAPLNWHGKVELDPCASYPNCMASSLDLRAIVLPVIANAARTEITPSDPRKAFSALATSALSQLPGARLAGFSFLTRLTRALPTFEARLSSNPTEIGTAMRRFLTGGCS